MDSSPKTMPILDPTEALELARKRYRTRVKVCEKYTEISFCKNASGYIVFEAVLILARYYDPSRSFKGVFEGVVF